MAIVHFALAVRDVRRVRGSSSRRSSGGRSTVRATSRWLRPGSRSRPGQEVHLLEIADYSPSPFEREYGRHIAVSVPRAQFPMLKQRLQEHGAEVFAAERATPFDRFFFRDGDGYVFEVVEAERASET